MEISRHPNLWKLHDLLQYLCRSSRSHVSFVKDQDVSQCIVTGGQQRAAYANFARKWAALSRSTHSLSLPFSSTRRISIPPQISPSVCRYLPLSLPKHSGWAEKMSWVNRRLTSTVHRLIVSSLDRTWTWGAATATAERRDNGAQSPRPPQLPLALPLKNNTVALVPNHRDTS